MPSSNTAFQTDLCASDLVDGHSGPLLTPWGEVSIRVLAEGFVAVGAWCPHMHGPLWEASPTGNELTCPWHGWRFSLRTGECTWTPASELPRGAADLVLHAVEEGPDGCLRILPPRGGRPGAGR